MTYNKGERVRVLPRLKDENIVDGEIDAVNSMSVVIKPDRRPHEGYRVTIPWADIKIGRYKLIMKPVNETTASNGMIII